MHTETDVITPELKPFQCRHIKTDGLRCRSACLRHEQFCYFHHTTRAPIQNPRERKAALGRREAFSLHLVEDRSSIQLAIARILQRIAANELDTRRAGLLLYGLQIASVNLPPIDRKATTTEEPVQDTIEDPTHGTIALAGHITKPDGEPGLEEILLKQWQEHPNPGPPPEEKEVIPRLQAVATSSKLKADQLTSSSIIPVDCSKDRHLSAFTAPTPFRTPYPAALYNQVTWADSKCRRIRAGSSS